MIFHASSACWSELVGGKLVPLFAYEPDPDSSHDDFYYNTTENRLYRLETATSDNQFRSKKWKRINE